MSNTPDPQPAQAGSLYREAVQEEPAGSAGGAPSQWAWLGTSAAKLAQAAVFGLIFGFLLQKGGVAKFDLLIGVLLLEEFTVIKVMGSAILVGMIGAFLLRRAGVVELQINPTKYGANIVGGLLFGVGFGLLAYCPGTDAAAVGQGNLDAMLGVVGLLLGSYLYAAWSDSSEATIGSWGKRGELTLPQVVGLPEGVFIALAAPLLIVILIVVEWYW